MNSILISGITPIDAYPKDISIKHCKQCMKKVELCIPSVKPDIEEANDLHINICVEKVKMIETILGPKLVIQGKIRAKLIYTADNKVQSVHSAHWEKTFCEYILLNDIRSCRGSLRFSNVFAGIEDVCVICVGKRDLSLSIIFILCPRVFESYDRENQTCCCSKEEHLNRLEPRDLLMGTEVKVIEYTPSRSDQDIRKEKVCECQEKYERYEDQDSYDQDRCYRKRHHKDDGYNMYRERWS